MLKKIRKGIEQALRSYLNDSEQACRLKQTSPALFAHIKEFFLRKGKRIRPGLCVVGYLGYAKRPKPGIYRAALSLEFLHDFMLVHDDIIDKSDVRRGRPSMHALLDRYVLREKKPKFNGDDLAIIAGDVMYALAIDALLSINEEPRRKEQAMRKLIEATLYTGSGEFIELLTGLKKIDSLSKNDIYKIYDLKTARYTFSSPLAIGALLAGAKETEINKLSKYGRYLGRAFQIQDDILGMFGQEKVTGKSSLTDLREAKKTLLILEAYQNSRLKNKVRIKKLLSKRNAGEADLKIMRRIITDSGALAAAKKEISLCLKKSRKTLGSAKLKPLYKRLLDDLTQEIIKA
jgi:geranylgeranyl diphosphate synthase type I